MNVVRGTIGRFPCICTLYLRKVDGRKYKNNPRMFLFRKRFIHSGYHYLHFRTVTTKKSSEHSRNNKFRQYSRYYSRSPTPKITTCSNLSYYSPFFTITLKSSPGYSLTEPEYSQSTSSLLKISPPDYIQTRGNCTTFTSPGLF